MQHAWEIRQIIVKFLVTKPKRKEPPGRPRRKWEDNIKVNPHCF